MKTEWTPRKKKISRHSHNMLRSAPLFFRAEFCKLSYISIYLNTILLNSCIHSFFLKMSFKRHNGTNLEEQTISQFIFLNKIPGSQFFSSSPSLQSSWPSHFHFADMHWPLEHWNWSLEQPVSQYLCYNKNSIYSRSVLNINKVKYTANQKS